MYIQRLINPLVATVFRLLSSKMFSAVLTTNVSVKSATTRTSPVASLSTIQAVLQQGELQRPVLSRAQTP